MSDGKDYIVRPDDNGTINISEEVIASIAALSLGEIAGVGGFASGSGVGVEIAELLGGKKSLTKGIKIEVGENSVAVDVYVLVKYGYPVIDVAKSIQNTVTAAVESATGLTVSAVNVRVNGITFEKEAKKQEK